VFAHGAERRIQECPLNVVETRRRRFGQPGTHRSRIGLAVVEGDLAFVQHDRLPNHTRLPL
jgi:hypothetical protein